MSLQRILDLLADDDTPVGALYTWEPQPQGSAGDCLLFTSPAGVIMVTDWFGGLFDIGVYADEDDRLDGAVPTELTTGVKTAEAAHGVIRRAAWAPVQPTTISTPSDRG